MDKSKWVWMPHPGHFICCMSCQFILNTYVGKYIVSTVGEYWAERAVREIHAETYDKEWLVENKHLRGDNFDRAYMEKFGYQTVGYDRLYETMVFKAKKSKYECCPWEQVGGKDIDFAGYNDAGDAYKGHLKMCEKWSKK